MSASTLVIACPQCGRSLKVKAELAGKKVKCSECAHAVPVPAIEPTTQGVPIWRRLWPVALVVLVVLVLGPIVFWLIGSTRGPVESPEGPPEALPEALGGEHYDFKGKPLPANMTPYGPMEDAFIKVEAEGVRVTLPKDRKLRFFGLSMPVSIVGDFEITSTFEILHVEEPTAAMRSYGLGVMMSINQAARIGRLARPQGEQVVTWDHWADVDGKRTFLSGASPCRSKVVRLQLRRTATTLHFLWAAGVGGEAFKEIHRCDFGADGINEIRFELNVFQAGEVPSLDFRVIELDLRHGRAKRGAAVTPPGRPN